MSALLLALSAVAAAPLESLTLSEAIDRALERAPRVATVRAQVQRADALVVQARAAWLPTVTLNGAFTQLEGNRGLGDRVLLPAQSGGGNLQLAFPLLAVPRWVATGQAELAGEAARADEREVRRLVTSLVGRAWITVALQQKLLSVAERAKRASAEQLELARLRQSGGLGTKLDLARAQRELADNEGRLARARLELATAREVLGVLVGEGGPLDATGVPGLEALPAVAALEQLVDARADVAAASTRLAAAQRAVDTSWTDYLPTANVVVQPTAQSPATPTQPSLGLSAQVSGQVVVFDGLARSGVRREREAALAAARAALDEARLRARSELRLAFEVLALREVSARAAADSARWALEAEQLARTAFKEGASTNVELIEAERAARDAETLAEAARASEWAARLELLVAAGARLAP